MIRTRGLILGAVVLAGLVAGMPGDAAAKKKRNKVSVSATVNGKKLKPTPRTLDISGGGGTIGLGVLAQKIPGGYRGTIKTLYVACATLWPPPALGVPLLACTGNYSESNTRNPGAMKFWNGSPSDDSTTVIIDAWDGVTVQGHFTATFTALSSGLPPVTVAGTFSGPVRIGDPNR